MNPEDILILSENLIIEVRELKGDVLERVEDLLDQGADATFKDRMGFDALMTVCAHSTKSEEITVRLMDLLVPVSDLHAVNANGWCATTIAARVKNTPALIWLIDCGAPMPADKEGLYPWNHTKDGMLLALLEAAELKKDLFKNNTNRTETNSKITVKSI